MRVLLFLSIFFSFYSVTAWAEEPLLNAEVQKKIIKELSQFEVTTKTLSSGSPEQIESWYANLQNMQKMAYDKVIREKGVDSSVAKRVATSLVLNTVSGWVAATSNLTMHEGAHGKVAEELGATNIYYQSDLNNGDQKLTLGELFITIILGRGSGSASTHYTLPIDATSEQRGRIAAAGLNYQMGYTDKMMESAWSEGEVHFLDTLPYVLNKASMASYFVNMDESYAGNDLQNYVQSLIDSGHITADKKESVLDQMKQLSVLSMLLSGGMWQSAFSQYEYIAKGNSRVPILGLKTPYGILTLPEFSPYLNAEGVSLKSSIAFLPGGRNLRKISLGLESCTTGECTGHDLSTEILYDTGNLHSLTRAIVSTNGRMGLTQGFEYDVSENLSIYGDLTYDTGTLEGQRRCYRGSEHCIDATIGFRYRF